MSDLRIQHTEEMVGAGHASKADTLNRLALAEHNNDGTHKSLTQVKDPWVDVQAYGAVGDGATDDTTAITNAFAYASTNKLGVKLQANKTYLVSNLTIAGTGQRAAFRGPQRLDLKGQDRDDRGVGHCPEPACEGLRVLDGQRINRLEQPDR